MRRETKVLYNLHLLWLIESPRFCVSCLGVIVGVDREDVQSSQAVSFLSERSIEVASASPRERT